MRENHYRNSPPGDCWKWHDDVSVLLAYLWMYKRLCNGPLDLAVWLQPTVLPSRPLASVWPWLELPNAATDPPLSVCVSVGREDGGR